MLLIVGTFLLIATCAQMVYRGLNTGHEGWIVAAGVVFFGVVGAATAIVFAFPRD